MMEDKVLEEVMSILDGPLDELPQNAVLHKLMLVRGLLARMMADRKAGFSDDSNTQGLSGNPRGSNSYDPV